MNRFFTVWVVAAVSAWAFADYTRTTTYSYDALGNVTVQTDAEERSQRTTYDVLGRPVGQVDALSHTNSVSYGVLGQMEGLTDANGNQTAWAFDPLGQLLTKTYNDGKQVHYTYDAAGRLESRRDASGGYTTYQYDALGQLRTNRFYASTNAATPAQEFVYTYDNIGRMLTADLRSLASTNVHTFTYDDTQNKQTVTVDYGSGVTMTSVYSYNQQTKQMTRVNGGVTNIYSYNADGQLLSVSIPGEGTVSYQYDANGLNTGIILPGGIRRIQSYDGFGQLESVQVKDAASNNVLSQSYQRDLTGSLQTKTTGSGVWNYRYDLTDQLTNAALFAGSAALRDTSHSYDAMGNRLQTSVSTNSTSLTVSTYSPNSLNQYLSISNSALPAPSSLLYDANGNLTNDSIRAYTWDLRNQLVEVETLPNAQSLRTKVCFSYDYMGRRIRKDVYSYSAQSQWSKAQSLFFFYDGWNLVRELELNPQSEIVNQKSYVWGNDLSGSLQGAGGVGGLLCSITQASGLTPQAFFYTYDHNGNVEKVISGGGAVVASFQYDAFGNTIQESIAQGLMSKDFPVRFSTKYFDSETGLAYYGYRYYSPEKGRWINRDPIGETGGANLYVVIFNNVLNSWDILGLSAPYRYLSRESYGYSKVDKKPPTCDTCGILQSGNSTEIAIQVDSSGRYLVLGNDGLLYTAVCRRLPQGMAATRAHEEHHVRNIMAAIQTANQTAGLPKSFKTEKECISQLKSVVNAWSAMVRKAEMSEASHGPGAPTPTASTFYEEYAAGTCTIRLVKTNPSGGI